jgi:hypothetical protein
MTYNELVADVEACDAAGCPKAFTSEVVAAAKNYPPGTVAKIARELHAFFGSGVERGYHRLELERRIAALGQPPAQASNPASGTTSFGEGLGGYYDGPEIGAPTPKGRFYAAMREVYSRSGGQP